MIYGFIFSTKMVPECKPEWNREAIMFFSRLLSLRRLQATPLIQTSLGGGVIKGLTCGEGSCVVAEVSPTATHVDNDRDEASKRNRGA